MSGSKRGERLTRDAIVQAALRLLDEEGLDGVTVRSLAAELGVQNPALYWHFRNKQELLDGMADEIVRAAAMGPPRKGEPWQRWLRRRARAYRDSLRAHRDGARVVSGARRLGAGTLAQFDQELAALVDCGFTPALALRTITAITLYTNGFVLQEQSGDSAGALPDGLELPTLIAALTEAGRTHQEDTFEHGLRALIDGSAEAFARSRPPTS